MSDSPLVSVIIPAYNSERYLAEAIESVLSQAYPALEVIVVDDGSTDGSARVAREHEAVRCVHQPHRGVCAALNNGIENARGGLLAFLDADDLWTEGKLERQVAALVADPDLEAVFGHVEQFASPELAETTDIRIPSHIERMAGYHKGTMLIRRKALLRVGLFDFRWEAVDFVDWYARAVEQGLRSRLLPEVDMRRRIHNDNCGVRLRDTARASYARILKASLDRRRQKDTSQG